MTRHSCPSPPDSRAQDEIEAGLIRGPLAYGFALGMAGVSTGIAWLLSRWVDPTNVAMVYLLGHVIVSARCGRAASIVSAAASVLAFDFFFVPPVLTLRFGATQYLITAGVLLVVGLVISTLAAQVRSQTIAATRADIAATQERFRNSLLTSLSHDLRTPLAVIAASASSVRENAEKLSAAERNQLLRAIYEQANSLNATVSDVLEMTHLHSGPVQLNRQWHPVEELIGAALARNRMMIGRRRLRVDLPRDLPMVYVDGVLVEKLLFNLVENALKYTPPNTLITIAAEHVGGEVRIYVEDDGPGLPVGMEERVFEKFFRLNPEGSAPGSGLGLSICRAIAELHGGAVTASRAGSGGAKFTVVLPYAAPPEMAQ